MKSPQISHFRLPPPFDTAPALNSMKKSKRAEMRIKIYKASGKRVKRFRYRLLHSNNLLELGTWEIRAYF